MRIPRFEMERFQSQWENVVELNISESGVTPLTIRELMAGAGDANGLLDVKLGYPQSNGTEELRANVAAFYPGATLENVLVTTGTAEANFMITWWLVELGAEVVVMMPNYMQVAGAVRGFGGAIKPLWLREELRWAPDMEELRRLVTPKTKLIAVCNPNNPTGAVLTEKQMDEICAIAAKAGAWILADEVYRGAELSGGLTPTFWGRYERVLCTAGLSKAFGLPGLRIGWVVGPRDCVESLWGYKDYTTIGITMLSDRLAAMALEPARRDRILERTRGILRQNFPLLRDWLARHSDLLRFHPPAAGAIAYVGYNSDLGWKSMELAESLRVKKSVLIVPASQFEMEGYLRIGFGYDQEILRRALARVDEVMFRAVAAD
jgi:aspartate/methionine/tyrosine aminotransferase